MTVKREVTRSLYRHQAKRSKTLRKRHITCMRHLRMPKGLPAGKGLCGSFSPSTLWLLYSALSMFNEVSFGSLCSDPG